MNILVTGAAGFIGSNVVRVLLEAGVQVRAMIVPDENQRNLEGVEVEKVEGNVLDPPSLDRALKGCDTLFHLAAIYSIWKKDRAIFYKVNLQGARNMLWAARKAGIEKIVFTSSVAALGIKPGKELSDEETAFNQFRFANDYVLTKYLSQEEALTFAREGLPLVVVCPGFPYGEGDIAPTPTGKMILDIVNGTNFMYFTGGLTVVDVKDVARGHLLAAKKGKVGEKYILSHKNFTIKDFFDLIAKTAGVRKPFLWSPVLAAKIFGALMEKMAERSGKPPMTTAREVPYLSQFFFVDNAKARRELGMEFTPVENSLQRAIDWFRRVGYISR